MSSRRTTPPARATPARLQFRMWCRAVAVLAFAAAPALAQPDPSGIEFVSITAPGNAPYRSVNPNDFVNGRGGVSYEYRIGRYEVTTAQWVEFFNAAYDRPDAALPHLLPPDFWGAAPTTPNNPGRQRWIVPAGNEMRPVGDISWRMAAMYCNWLHNGKSADRGAFLNGAYDVSTFGFTPGGTFTDQPVHSPGAHYWIPTWDEWLKAAHYDPNKSNPDGSTGGWWQYSNGSDTPYVYGPPGTGQANAGFTNPNPFAIPLGAYPDIQSPWGLLDMAGATTEWTESIFDSRYRVFDGSQWAQDPFQSMLMDRVREWGGEYPHVPTYEFGLRIASSVPAPGPWAVGAGVLCILGLRRRRAARAGVLLAAALSSAALAQPGGEDPSGIDFVTITAPGNAPWAGNGTEGDRAVGRGGVNYEYRIGRYEVTTSQWVEFFNAAYDRADAPLPHLLPPTFWGATPTTPNNPGRQRWSVPAGNEMLPTGNISWRMAAMYCNWLHNGKTTDRSAFLNGAYDVSTFTYADIGFNDQLTHNPDARYWIPTWDEWLKAAHYDPAAAQWRIYPNGTDTPLVYGPPGVLVNGQPTQANGGWVSVQFPGYSPFAVPLGAYADVQSPWGLFDVAGGTKEWTEYVNMVAGLYPIGRRFDGSAWATSQAMLSDQIYNVGGDFPSLSTYDLGFRIASSVPAPGFSALGTGLLFLWSTRPRRSDSRRRT